MDHSVNYLSVCGVDAAGNVRLGGRVVGHGGAPYLWCGKESCYAVVDP